MEQPLVSIIMPCYNMATYIAESIKSVIAQTYTNWEMLIVDNISNDNTVEIVKRFCAIDERIRLILNEQQIGIGLSRNKAIREAKGYFLAFLDADDIWSSEKLSTQVAFMTEKNVGFSFTSYDCIDEKGDKLQRMIRQSDDMRYQDYLHNTVIGCSTVMLNTDIIGPVTMPDFRTSEDTATWLGILRKGHCAYSIDKILVSYRIRKQSASSNKFKAACDLWTVYRKQERLPLFKTIGCFSSYAYHALKRRFG